MITKIMDSLCGCKQSKIEKETIQITKPEQLNEKNSTLSPINANDEQLIIRKKNGNLTVVPNNLVSHNEFNLNLPNLKNNQKLTLLKLPEELIKKKIKMFGSGSSRKKIINENIIFQNFQDKVDNIIEECLKQKTISESEDSEL